MNAKCTAIRIIQTALYINTQAMLLSFTHLQRMAISGHDWEHLSNALVELWGICKMHSAERLRHQPSASARLIMRQQILFIYLFIYFLNKLVAYIILILQNPGYKTLRL